MFKLTQKFSILLLAIAALFTMSACDGATESSIPNVSFRLTYNTAQYPLITTPGFFTKVTRNTNGIAVGYGGLILGKSVFTTFGDDNYVAYDAACPVEANSTVSVNVVEDGLGTAVCPKCGTKYNLSNGAFPEGVGTEYLKSYPVVVNGTTLIVNN